MSKRKRSKKTIEEREQEILERMRREEEEQSRAEREYTEVREDSDAEREAKIKERSEQRKARAKKSQTRKLRIPSLAVVLVIAFVLLAGAATIKTIMSLQLEHARLEKENEDLTKKRDKLKIELKHVNSREYIEEQARRQLRLVNPDEILFIFHSDSENEKDLSSAEDAAPESTEGTDGEGTDEAANENTEG